MWLGRMLTYIAELSCIDSRLMMFLFFSTIWIICRIGNARLFRLRLVNGMMFVSIAVILEVGIAFFIAMLSVVVALPDWGYH